MAKRNYIIFTVFLLLTINIVSATIESDFLNLINKERAGLNKPLLYYNENLTNTAYLHSKEMSEKDYFSHDSYDGSSFDKRIISSGYTNFKTMGENIAYASGSADANKVFSMWKSSIGHYDNMISSSFSEIGLGVYSHDGLTYYTLDFGSREGFIPPANNNPAQISNSSNIVLDNPSVELFSSLNVTESRMKQYRLIRFIGNLNEKSGVYYVINNKLHKICNRCNKFSRYIKTKENSTKFLLIAIDIQGKNETRTINI